MLFKSKKKSFFIPACLFHLFYTFLFVLFFAIIAEPTIIVAKKEFFYSDLDIYLFYTFVLFFKGFIGTFIFSIFLYPLLRKEAVLKYYLIISAFIYSLLLIIIFIDFKSYTVLGLHIYSPYVIDQMMTGKFFKNVPLNLKMALSIVGVIVFVFATQLVIVYTFFKNRLRISRIPKKYLIIVSIVLALVFKQTSGGIQKEISRDQQFGSVILEALPGFQLFYPEKNTNLAYIIDYPKGKTGIPKIKRKPNVLFMMIESLRADMMDKAYMPNIMEFQEKNDCIRSNYHYSGSHTTHYGFFSLFYGLNSYNYHSMIVNGKPSYPLQVLKENGYASKGIACSNIHGNRHERVITSQMDSYDICDSSDSGDRDLVTWNDDFQKSRDKSKPFFMFNFLFSPHHNFFYPPEFEKFKPVIAKDYNHFMNSDKLKVDKEKIFNRYKNSVLYTDHLFSKLMEIYESELKADNLIVVFVGDHAEEFWDRGFFSHGRPYLINQRTQTPLLFCLPGIESKTVPVTSHTDIWPTILDYMGTNPLIPSNDFSNGISLLKPYPENKLTIVTGTGYPFHTKPLTVITSTQKLWFNKSGERFYDLKYIKATDLNDDPINNPSQEFINQFSTDLVIHLKRFQDYKYITP